jgi:hypothetical protein
MTNELLRNIMHDSNARGDVANVFFAGNIIGISLMKPVSFQIRIAGNPFKALHRPKKSLWVSSGSGTLLAVSLKPPTCEGLALVRLHQPLRKDIEVVGVRIEDVGTMPKDIRDDKDGPIKDEPQNEILH